MKHKVYGKHLGRDKNQRASLFKNLIQALILHGSIQTTESKAKAIKGEIDKIINQAKSKNTQRLLQTFLINKQVREKLTKEIVLGLKDRVSGYSSITKLGQRSGDGAMMVRLSLLGIDQSSVVSESVAEKQKTDKRKKSTPKKAATRRLAK